MLESAQAPRAKLYNDRLRQLGTSELLDNTATSHPKFEIVYLLFPSQVSSRRIVPFDNFF